MASKGTKPRPTVGDRVSDARVEKTKRKIGPVRRLENGLLDVTRKSGKYVKM